nr:pumilio homolog 23-like [Ipomoea trifida]
MVSIGQRALLLRNNKAHNLTEEGLTPQDEISFNQYKKKRNMGRKDGKKHSGFPADNSAEYLSIDPKTEKYFAEITNVIEGKEIDLEERSVICGNALEETRGQEVELATDYVISHTLQILLEGCSLDHLCGFLHSCAKNFSHIATDRSGSHVAETALKSLAVHLQDCEQLSLIEETLRKICEVIIEVAPETIYKELLQRAFKNSLFQIRCHLIIVSDQMSSQSMYHITSLEEHQLLEASKDPCDSRVIEAFLNSNVSAKHKRKLLIKLQGHFGELSVHPLGSFMIEKCFNASNLPLREKIISEMLPLQAELSRTKQGPYLLRRFDIEGVQRLKQRSRPRSNHLKVEDLLSIQWMMIDMAQIGSNDGSVRDSSERTVFEAAISAPVQPHTTLSSAHHFVSIKLTSHNYLFGRFLLVASLTVESCCVGCSSCFFFALA